jgi:sirohydrochlorin ferrochelatase
MQVAGLVTTLVLTAHGSADPRPAANTRAVAALLSRLRPGLDVRVASLEQNAPTLGDVLARPGHPGHQLQTTTNLRIQP